MLEDSFSIIHIVVPIMSAMLCVGIQNPKFARTLSLSVAIIAIIHSFYTPDESLYQLGGWATPYGIELKSTHLGKNIVMLLDFVLFITLLCHSGTEKNWSNRLKAFFYALILICYSGFIGVTLSNDFFNIYVFLEISSLSGYALIAFGGEKPSWESAFHYLIIGTVGVSFYLLGVGLIYMLTGSLNIDHVANQLELSKLSVAAFTFIFIGIGLKSAMAPLHSWIVGAYSTAHKSVAIFLSGTSINVSMYVLIKAMNAFSINGISQYFYIIIACAALFSIFFGSLAASVESNYKKLLAYSSISQIWYVIIAIIINSPEAAKIQIIAHTVTKIALFASINSHNLLSKATLIFGALSLIGIPPTLGFIAKWELLNAILVSANYFYFCLMIISFCITAIYAWKLIEYAAFSSSSNHTQETTFSHSISLFILIVCISLYGLI